MNLDQKINWILNFFTDEELYKQYGINTNAKYWKMATDFLKMFERLYINIVDKDVSFPLVCDFDEDALTTEGNNDTYFFSLNHQNVTPCSFKHKNNSVALNTMGQYVRTILAFGVGIYEQHYDNIASIIKTNGQIRLVHDIKLLIKKDNWINLIQKIILEGAFSNLEDKRNIAYSIIIEMLYHFNYDFTKLIGKNRILQFKKSIGKYNDKEAKTYSLIEHNEKIRNDIYEKGTIATYITIINTIDFYYQNSLEAFIDDLYELIQSKLNQDEQILDSIDLDNHLWIAKRQAIDKLESNRSKFKNNIYNDRHSKGLIKSKNDLYTDIVDIDNNEDGLLSKFNESNACHIFDYHKAKKIILDAINKSTEKNFETIYDSVMNPNNGLMMRIEYHKSFDIGKWTFDTNGNMLVAYEEQNYVFAVLKLKRIKIKQEVLNDEMKEFLNMR